MKLKISKFDRVTSTNDVAIKLIKKNIIKNNIIIAKTQTKGKGTMGKKWISRKGNIFVSIFFDVTSTKIKIEEFTILNSYLIKNILKKYSNSEIKIKWPNDLLVKGRKICGILQEVIEFEEKKYLVIGIGVNTKIAPNSKQFKSISLLECSNYPINNRNIIKNISNVYEKLLNRMKKKNILDLRKKYV